MLEKCQEQQQLPISICLIAFFASPSTPWVGKRKREDAVPLYSMTSQSLLLPLFSVLAQHSSPLHISSLPSSSFLPIQALDEVSTPYLSVAWSSSLSWPHRWASPVLVVRLNRRPFLLCLELEMQQQCQKKKEKRSEGMWYPWKIFLNRLVSLQKKQIFNLARQSSAGAINSNICPPTAILFVLCFLLFLPFSQSLSRWETSSFPSRETFFPCRNICSFYTPTGKVGLRR